MACKIVIRSDQEQELNFEVPLSTSASELKKKVVEHFAENGGEVGKKVTLTSMVRLFYMGKELGGKNADKKLEDYEIPKWGNIIIMNINVGQPAPSPSEKSSNCPCAIM